ncbi:aspartyl/glutamyl-tRNA(Asn/Gln) amidotransferase subunit A [Halomicrobium zhouii]|uniref:Glutamyl-tRNA(Gln) amidotransferase subunit A n=1 Tax=Halomicrobium zhouii TaxID=767519 RepID=A0A1I6LZ42_9EURY|nr:Asp-tRNA(Asn)/Glu-tRNA(Gln) amidotransferase subunit GatA [Halomicrobium zhouii]SFS08644.1 aspartyl/glutamyl-tRNA(Asn/Gln) amidotransferase subunit A [Halomicrobium zhouii]
MATDPADAVDVGDETDDATDYNGYVTTTEIAGDDDGPLAGKTIAVKDNISTEGVRTTCGSAMLADYVPPYDATVVERLKQAGATITGKTNMDEFGMGSTTETSAFGPTDNPAAPGHVPGGSSGGSAAVVAAGDADLALGTDTGGSVRNPAAFCGVVGIKPTYGLVSRYGLVAYANSLEQIGPIAPSVEEAAELLEVVAGPDPNDATTEDATDHGTDYDFAAAADGDVDGLSIGVPTELVEPADEAVTDSFWSAIDDLESQGASYHDVDLPSVEHAVEAYYVIAMSEASSNLARFDGVRYGYSSDSDGNWNEAFAETREEGFGKEVKRRVVLGTYALSAGYHDKYYKQAQDARAWVKQDFDESLSDADVLAAPTMPVPPMERGENLEDPMALYLADANTTPVNLADLPAISVPIEETSDGLPVGMQFVGPAFGEKAIIRAGSALA